MRPEIIDFKDNIPVKAFVRGVSQYPYHWHDALEIIYILKGSVNLGIGTEYHLLQEGNIAVVNVDELHRLEGNGQENQILFLQVDGSFYRNILPANEFVFIYCCSTYHETDVPEKYDKLKEFVMQLVLKINEQSTADNKKAIESLMSNMLTYLTDNFDYLRWGPGTEAFDEKQAERLKQVTEIISTDQSENPGLKDIAAEVDVSIYHLSHDIKEKFGYTFQELLFYTRIEQAAKLLISTDKRIVDIAMECDFSDPKYLIKHFKLNYQCTPSEFRKMHQISDKALTSQQQYKDYPLSEAIRFLDVSNVPTGVIQ